MFQELAGSGDADSLRAALELWRGPALHDVPLEPCRIAAVRLDQRRLAVLERRVDLDLGLGRFADLAAELTVLVREHPLRERLWAQLMLALYGSGRQGEALGTFRRLRSTLVDQLGIEPSAVPRHVEHAMLAGGDALAAYWEHLGERTPPTTAPVTPAPAQLPAAVSTFTGRTRDLDRLDAALADATESVAIAVVTGAAGVGKTTLAVHWAHRVRDRFSDGQLYVNLRGFDPTGQIMSPTEALCDFLIAMGVPPERIPPTLDAQAGLYRSMLAGRRVLVVLDNARDAEHARLLLPATPTTMAVVTSRDQLTGLVTTDAAQPLTLDVLTPPEARDLLARRLGADRVAAEPDAVEQIITATARLPLALSIAAARTQQSGFSLTTLAAQLTEEGQRLDALDTGDPATQIRAVFSWSYTALNPSAARLFRLLGLHPGPDISSAAAASLARTAPSQVRQLLAEITRASLLIEHTPGRYAFHDLLRSYSADLAHTVDTPDERRASAGRVLDHYLHTADVATGLLDPHRDPPCRPLPAAAPGATPEDLTDRLAAVTWLTAEHPVLLATLRQAAHDGFDTQTWRLAWSLDTFLYRQGHWHDQTTAWQAALAAADRLGDPAAQAHAHRRLARFDTRLRHYHDARARLTRALHLCAQSDDQAGEADTHVEFAFLWEQQARHDRALRHAQQALTIYQATGHRTRQAAVLNVVGWCHAHLGDLTQALAWCERALAVYRQVGDRDGEANTLDSLGYTHHQLTHHAQAIDCYQHAVTLFRDIGDRLNESITLVQLGDTHRTTGDHPAARTAWRHALNILTDLNHPNAGPVRAKLRGLDLPDTPSRTVQPVQPR